MNNKTRHIQHSIPPGLLYRPTLTPEVADGTDFFGPFRRVEQEFSVENQRVLKEAIESIPQARLMMEIGVERLPNSATSSTQIILNNRPPGCGYIGVDKRDCGYLSKKPNSKFLRTDTRNAQLIRATIDKMAGELDLLFIDGNRSVEWVLTDWQYSVYVRQGGVIVVHDSNTHPGPIALLDALDPEYFECNRLCTGANDWGIAVLRIKKALSSIASRRKACLLVQGPLTKVDNMLPMCEQAQTIWSTWDTEPTASKQKLVEAGVHVVESKLPEAGLRGGGNANLQIASSEAGVLCAKQLGYSHVFRVRHDVAFDNPQIMIDNVSDNIGFLGWYRGYPIDYVISGPVDKLLILFGGWFPKPQTGKISCEKFLFRRYQHWFPYDRAQYLFPIMKRNGVVARWHRDRSSTVDPLNKYYQDGKFGITYPDLRVYK